MRRWALITACVLFAGAWMLAGCSSSAPAESGGWRAVRDLDPPEITREFRGVWVATVANIDWPSRPGLDSHVQQGEAVAILDRVREIGLNAVVLQVRPSADVMYPSELEPWSEFLAGRSGKAPEPFYDPVRFWIDEAHARGLDVHLWINPFRARHFREAHASDASRVDRSDRSIVRTHGKYLWMDPSEPEARRRTLAIVRELMSRYDADGLHLDDYFYPYPGDGGPFDDAASFARARASDPSLSRGDWRRAHVNRLVCEISVIVREERPGALFGISPFGIWRPDHPRGVRGLDAFEELAADARLWLREGWVDYIAPQLYWTIDSKGQPFESLLRWWRSENIKGRHVWPGLYTSRIGGASGWSAQEIADQVEIARGGEPWPGHVHYSAVALLKDRGGVAGVLDRGVYRGLAVPPPSPWLDLAALPAPSAAVVREGAHWRLEWSVPGAPDAGDVRRFVVQTRRADGWQTHLFGSDERSMRLDASCTAVVVRAHGTGGRLSAAVMFVRDNAY